MINYLSLKNLVLIDSCALTFFPHFTALTGETGAGKTALIEGIDLALGARADSAMIRTGEEKAYVEAAFDITDLPYTRAALEEAHISFTPDEDLIIRRELSREGKNRAFINGQLVSLPLLQKIGSTLIELIGQHTYHTLTSSETQRIVLDQYAALQEEVKKFQTAHSTEKELKAQLNSLLLKESTLKKEEEHLRKSLEEIHAVKLRAGEEEELVEEHKRLSHLQEFHEKLTPILQGLSHILPSLNRFYKSCESLTCHDSHLTSCSTLLHEMSIAATEACNELQKYLAKLEKNPHRFTYVEERLGTLESLKRKYGRDFEEIQLFEKNAQEKLQCCENLSEEIDALRGKIAQWETKTGEIAHRLSAARKKSAEDLATSLTMRLQTLNMEGAEIQITVQPTGRNAWGDDTVTFWMRANIGEHFVLVKDHSSGGELSRLLFAIKTILSEKNHTPTLIFDEIDANVGGKTATTIGKQLKELAIYRQVICITHFPQVAAQADHHLSVQKKQRDGRTITTISSLDQGEREKELLRMLGGEKPTFSLPL